MSADVKAVVAFLMGPFAGLLISIVGWGLWAENCDYDAGYGTVHGQCWGSWHHATDAVKPITGLCTIVGLVVAFCFWTAGRTN